MKRQLALACTCALLALTALPVVTALPAHASNGDISIVATVDAGAAGHERECAFDYVKFHSGNANGNPFPSCVQTISLKVYGVLTGASAGGITGCEFLGSIGATTYGNTAPGPFTHASAADPGWVFLELPNPDAIVRLGNAFRPPDPSARGLRQSWDACQTGTNGKVLIEELIISRTAACGPDQTPATLELSTGGHDSPSNVFFRCPLFTLCDAPAFTKVCLGDNAHACTTPVPPFNPTGSTCSNSGLFTINPQPDPVTGIAPGWGDCVKANKGAGSSGIATEATWSTMKGLYR